MGYQGPKRVQERIVENENREMSRFFMWKKKGRIWGLREKLS
jgi:hypothetical protein